MEFYRVEKTIKYHPSILHFYETYGNLTVVGGYVRRLIGDEPTGNVVCDIDVVPSSLSYHELENLIKSQYELKANGYKATDTGFYFCDENQTRFNVIKTKNIEDFDYTMCQVYATYDDMGVEVKAYGTAVLDIKNKRLVPTEALLTRRSQDDTLRSIIRLSKYIKQGYTIDMDNLSKISKRLGNLIYGSETIPN